MPIHTVKQGETLNTIASEYGASAELIALQNELDDTNSLVIGQQLLILVPKLTHTVKDGDTLYSIAAMHSISVNELLCNNPWLSTMPLSIGMSVIIEYKEADRARQIVTNAYAYTNTPEMLLRRAMPYLSFITVFTYGFTSDGTLIPPEDERILSLASEYGTPPIMLLSTLTEDGTFSNRLAADILGNKTTQEVLLSNVMNTMLEKGYKGLDIDFEYLPVEDRDNYAAFVAYFTQELNKYGFITLVALAPKSSATQTGLLYEGHDYAKLGSAANLSLAMTYEWGYTYGPPMPVSPIAEVEQVISYAVTDIAAQRLLMGIPLYGYDFRLPYIRGESKATSLSPQQAIALAAEVGVEISYDESAQAPYYYYTRDGAQHIVWFENAQSNLAKLNLVKKYNLAGVSYWSLNRDFPQAFLLVNQDFNIFRPQYGD